MSQGTERAYWTAEAPPERYPPLPGPVRYEVAIIGGGIVGLSLAERLKRAGRQVVVVENARVGAQVTGRSTAKVTALHGLVYDELIRQHGFETAKAYADANSGAIRYVQERTREFDIHCNLTSCAAYTISEQGARRAAIDREVAAAQRLGLPVERVSEAVSPIAFDSGIRMADQFQFQPYRYCLGLARAVHGDNAAVHEGTRAYSIRFGQPHEVVTDHGIITADHVVIATNLPFMDRGLFFAKASPRQHVVIAARLPDDVPLEGMFLNVDPPGYSFRRFDDGQGPVLILTGAGTRLGHQSPSERLTALRTLAAERFGAAEALGWWFNEDYDSVDRLPFVGPLTPVTPSVHVATGFSAWGLTNGTAAAQMLASHIQGETDVTRTPFSATRWSLRTAGRKLFDINLHVGREFIADRSKALNARPAKDLKPGEGGIRRHHGRPVAAYRDDAGELHLLSPRCSHLGCYVSWNGEAKTWECPCHGSVFDHDGRMLHGPAVWDLKRFD